MNVPVVGRMLDAAWRALAYCLMPQVIWLSLLPLMLAGALAFALHVAIAASGVEYLHYLSALILLGIGWNFLYVGGSTLLTETYRPSERARVQAINDFIVVGVSAVGSFSAGVLNELIGWEGLNLAVLPLVAAAALTIVAAQRAPSPAKA